MVKSNLIQIGLIGSSLKCSLPPSPSQAQLVNLHFFRARKFKTCASPSRAKLGFLLFLRAKPSQPSLSFLARANSSSSQLRALCFWVRNCCLSEIFILQGILVHRSVTKHAGSARLCTLFPRKESTS